MTFKLTQWIRETLSVVPNHSVALSLRTAIQTEGRAISVLPIANAVSRAADCPAGSVRRAILPPAINGRPSPGLASEVKTDVKIDGETGCAGVDSWLMFGFRLNELGAERLWNSERYAEAAPILRKKYDGRIHGCS